MDLGGQYVLPGLINLHVHLPASGKPKKKASDPKKLVKLITANALTRRIGVKLCEGYAKTELLSGVTTIRTVGGVADFDTIIRDLAAQGKILSPRVVASNMAVSVPGGHMAGSLAYEAKTPEEAAAMLEEDYFVTPERAALALETGSTALTASRKLGPKDIAVYIGIPFCPTRCAYCSFVSQSVERSFALVPPYVDALIEEIKAGGKMVREERLRCRAFYMGGGTPTTLTAEQMDRVLTAFEESFDLSPCEEITVEAGRPDTITAEKLAVLRAHGVTRVSVNPQTMEDHVLRAIGRCHTAGDIEAAMELVAKYEFPHVNMDLIAGLPEDSPEGFRRSLDRCLAFGTDNVTVHTLALKKGSRILLEGLSIPGPEAVAEMLDYAAPTLRSAGYGPYYLYRQKYMSGSFENIGWCRPGAECWYNVYIMSELCSILSFGAGGSTKMVEPGTNHIERVFNLKYPKEYTERPEKCLANQAAFAAFYRSLKGAQ